MSKRWGTNMLSPQKPATRIVSIQHNWTNRCWRLLHQLIKLHPATVDNVAEVLNGKARHTARSSVSLQSRPC